MSVVVDASVVIKWFVPEAGSDAATRLLTSEDRLELDTQFADAEANGIVGPSQGSKPLDIPIRAEDYPPASG